MAKTLQFRRGTTSELALITPAAGEILIDTTLNTIKIGNDTVEGGKVITGLAGTSYIYVTGNGTDTANGEELAAAYALAKTMTPYGSYPTDPDNRVKVIIAPGKYYVGGGTAFPNNRWDIDAHCIDIVSLTGNRDVWIIGTINIAGGDLGSVIIRGLDVSDGIYVANGLQYLRMENCKASSLAHCDVDAMPISLSGTFIDCEAVSEGFATVSGSDASGTFINCKAELGFGFYDCNASGVFTNCTIGYSGFAYSYSNTGYGIASGTFTNCTSAYEGFGGGLGGQASGVFTNCVGSNGSFVGYQTGPNTFSGTITGTLNYCRLTSGEFAPTSGSGKLHYCIDGNGKEVTSGGGLGGTSYVFVAGDQSSAVANGQQLLNAYALAKTMTPFGNSKDVYNRVQVVVAPGSYYFPNDDFNIDTDYVDVVSLTGNRDVLLDFINVTADNVYLKGLDLWSANYPFTIYGNQPNLKIENCSGGYYSFSGDSQSTKGTFINCLATYHSFGGRDAVDDIGYGIAQDATFIDCTALDYSFAGADNTDGSAETSSKFVNCKGGNYCFGGIGYAGGTFTNCTAGDYSFGGTGNVSGTFTNCTAGNYSFGGIDTSGVSGIFNNCTAGYNSFGGNYSGVGGTFNNCISTGLCSFGGDYSNVSGTFTNCKASSNSFGGDYSISSGTFTNCSTIYGFSFGGIDSTASGTYNNCTGNENGASFGGNTAGTFSGIANNCTAGNISFGQGGLTGKLYFCRLTLGTYPTPGVGGKIRFCLDGNDDPEDITQYLP
jgi:hypothetical protein